MSAAWELRLGDCLDPVTGMASLGDKSVDHVITDPPYSAWVHSKGRRMGPSDGSRLADARPLDFSSITDAQMSGLACEAARISRRWSLVFCEAESIYLWRLEFAATGGEYVRAAFWHKLGSTPQFTGDRPAVACEAIVCAHAPGKKRWNGGGKHGFYAHGIVKDERFHLTQKPDGLMSDLVRDFTDPGDLILDPFAGSGTTGVAAIRLGRRFLGWERDPKYHAIAVKRLTAAKEQLELCA